MAELRSFLVSEVAAGRRFYPPADRVFNAFALTPFDAVRVVVLGQDPYHGPGQAMGLCFSVPPRRAPAAVAAEHPHRARARPRAAAALVGRPDAVGRARRPAAQRRADGLARPRRLARGRRAGSASPTARSAELSERRDGIVFLLWGRYAQQKGAVVDAAAPPRAHVGAPVAAERVERLLRVPPLLQGERAARGRRPRAGRLGSPVGWHRALRARHLGDRDPARRARAAVRHEGRARRSHGGWVPACAR